MEEHKHMTVGDWMVTLLILAIPIVNIVMYLFWAFSSTGNINRKNYCMACLLWFLILVGVGISVLVMVLIIGALAGSANM